MKLELIHQKQIGLTFFSDSSTDAQEEDSKEKLERGDDVVMLRRELGLLSAVGLIVSVMIGGYLNLRCIMYEEVFDAAVTQPLCYRFRYIRLTEQRTGEIWFCGPVLDCMGLLRIHFLPW